MLDFKTMKRKCTLYISIDVQLGPVVFATEGEMAQYMFVGNDNRPIFNKVNCNAPCQDAADKQQTHIVDCS